jgi:S-disulfanyl-L-cysteine oxidoreductase SoxD
MRSSRPLAIVVVVAAMTTACAVATSSRSPATTDAKFGRPIADADIAPWDIDIRTSTGKGLPPGRGGVAEGKTVYDAKCLACHGPDAKGGPVYGSMVGGIGSFTTSTRVLTPGSMYPYAPILFDYIRRAMPMDAPATLSDDEVYSVSAYLLYLNKIIGVDDRLDADSLPRIRMPNRDGFIGIDAELPASAASQHER